MAVDRELFKWWLRAWLWFPKPTEHPEYHAEVKKLRDEPYGMRGDAEQILADQQKVLDFALAGTPRMEDRVHNTMLVAMGLATFFVTSFSWTKPEYHYITKLCLGALAISFVVLFKLRVPFDKPLFPPWHALGHRIKEVDKNAMMEYRARVCQLLFVQHTLIQRVITAQLVFVLLVMALTLYAFLLLVPAVSALSP